MDLPAPAALPAAQVHALLDSGEAVPLLPGHWPVPVRIAGRWWHVPAATEEPAANGGGHSCVAASPAQAAAYERLAARVDAAAAGTPRPQREPPPGATAPTLAARTRPSPTSPRPRCSVPCCGIRGACKT